MKTVVLGGGRACREIIELAAGPFMRELRLNIRCVMDPDPNAPGMVFARELYIATTSNLSEALSTPNLELIIELTGRDDVLEQLLQWENKRDAFKRFIDNSEEALSPKQLLYEPPLNRMTKENKEWLGEVIHALFLTRTGIKNKALELRVKMDEIDKIVDTIARVLRVETESADSTGEKIISIFIEFSREISDLPHEIQVV